MASIMLSVKSVVPLVVMLTLPFHLVGPVRGGHLALVDVFGVPGLERLVTRRSVWRAL